MLVLIETKQNETKRNKEKKNKMFMGNVFKKGNTIEFELKTYGNGLIDGVGRFFLFLR